jgi:hypothetical protein
MNDVLFNLKNCVFDAVYSHYINQWHANHTAYHIW